MHHTATCWCCAWILHSAGFNASGTSKLACERADTGWFCFQFRELEALPLEERGALWGVPFGVKDNIDVAGFPTSAACKAFSSLPAASAPVVQQLLAAGGSKHCTEMI